VGEVPALRQEVLAQRRVPQQLHAQLPKLRREIRHAKGNMTDHAGIPALQDAIRRMHGCESRWIDCVPVRETHDGRTVWDGEV
jgi:hypothetical protein